MKLYHQQYGLTSTKASGVAVWTLNSPSAEGAFGDGIGTCDGPLSVAVSCSRRIFFRVLQASFALESALDKRFFRLEQLRR